MRIPACAYILLSKIYQLIILKHKGVFALIMGNQCTAALTTIYVWKKNPNGSTEHDKSLKKGLTWPQRP